MVSRHQDFPGGHIIKLEGGQVIEQKAVGAPSGTVITVENLFYNTPARMKFLKKENTEKRHMALIVSRYAMAYPHVRFILEQDGREVFRSNGSGYLGDVLVTALGLETFRDMVELNPDSTSAIQVAGYTSVPSLHRADRTHITLFVNGRWIQDTRLAYAVTQAYHTFLMTGRYPVAVLLINLPSEDVDVNVHPTKAEVRFRDGDGVFAALQRVVRRAIIDLAQTPTMRGGYYTEHGKLGDWSGLDGTTQLGMSLELESAGQYAHQRYAVNKADESTDPTAIPAGAGAPARPRTLPILRVVGQISATYIVAEGPAGVYLIDQHAAHERILYEQFMEEHTRQGTVAQYALAAQSLHLPPVEAHLIEENLEPLKSVGFDLEPFGPNTYVVRAVPAMLASQSPTEVLVSILEDLELGEKPGQSSIEDRIVMRVCKQAAVKAGQILSIDEMQGLIRQLERCQSPLTCPHGRPTMIHMTTDQLARQFGRLG
jgi:DNA mismatch repair protein MutL